MATTVTLNFANAHGDTQEVTAKVGQSVMEAAVMADVPGIEAECGGCCNCATCHVFAPAGFEGPNEQEDELLDNTVTPRTESSRLSCQIEIDARLDGIVFVIPGEQ